MPKKKIHVTKTECRKRVKSPKKFDKKSFRSKRVSKRTRLIVACPKGKFKKGRCSVGMQLQSIIKKKKKDGSCPVF